MASRSSRFNPFFRAPQARNDTLNEKPRGDGPSRFALQKLDAAATKARATESLVSSSSAQKHHHLEPPKTLSGPLGPPAPRFAPLRAHHCYPSVPFGRNRSA